MNATLALTDEQLDALDGFRSGETLKVVAGAGAGKTSTLLAMADSMPDGATGRYLAFNRSIVDEAKRKMPDHIVASTVHSLAFAGIDERFKDRVTRDRMPSFELARRYRVMPMTFRIDGHANGELHALTNNQVASLAFRGVTRFCESADLVPAACHVPHVPALDWVDDRGRRHCENNDAIAAALVPLMNRMWADISNPHGPVPVSLDHVVKLYELSDFDLGIDVLLMDECQPPDTIVSMGVPHAGRTPDHQEFKRIEDVEIGDWVLSYTKGNGIADKRGSRILGKTTRHFDGELIRIKTPSGLTSRYTPNHICMASFGKVFEGRHLVYLMRKGDRWRVGVAKERHGQSHGRRQFGVVGRMREEKGEQLWILESGATRVEAEALEEYVSLRWGIPQARFGKDIFWNQWDVELTDAEGCLAHFGREIAYPMIQTKAKRMMNLRFTEIRACNLMSGMEVMNSAGEMETIELVREPYSGPVVSLTVSGPKTYIGDGIVTHNCQDVNAVFASICMKQMARGTQLVAVGDENQAIYGWRGAIDAFKLLPAATRTATLSMSFRFGPAIAEVANIPLAELGADLRIRGNPAKDSVVGPVKVPDAFLCRTNATAVEKYLEVTRRGFRTHLMGGASEMLSFARAAEKLQAGRTVEHPDLGGFADWAEVGAYVRNDPSGRDLATSYDLVEQFGAAKLVKALSGLSKTPRPGEVIVSTAHKAKGREWPTVRLADDFAFHHPDRPVISDEELRLLYVAATRAQDVLAVDRTRYFNPRHQGAGSCR